MISTRPRYLLLTESVPEGHQQASAWRFVLCHQATGETTSVREQEPEGSVNRMALLALVRGLEAIPVPARVTVITPDRHIRKGLEKGLTEWLRQGWKWERFGRLVTVRDDDLWRRVARALEIHQVECRSWRLSLTDHTPHHTTEPPHSSLDQTTPASDPPANPSPATARTLDSPADLAYEPALLVVRRPKRVLRFDRGEAAPAGRPARQACVG